MPEQALYLKWRPTTFDDVVGQEHVTRTLRNSLVTGRVRHAYLFSGPRGTGKTTTARLLAKAVNCQNEDPGLRPCNTCEACLAVNEGRYLDLIEIDAATHTGVDDVRSLRDKITLKPNQGEGRYKVYIIDEVHRFTGNAFDALLKTLEEPPDHAIFVLATTEVDKVPQTIKSRCLQFEFRRVSLQQVADRLEVITHEEGLRVEREALELIARHGTGSVRDSISLLDQIVSDPQEVVTLNMAQRILGTGNMRAVGELVEALLMQNVQRGLHVINTAIDAGSDPRQFGQQIVEHLRAVLVTQSASADLLDASNEERDLYERQAAAISRGSLVRAIRAFNEAVNDFKGGWQPQLGLELAFIESLKSPEPDPVMVMQRTPERAHERPAESEEHAEVQAMPAGSPPVVTLAAIQEKWEPMLHMLYQLNKTAPDVVQRFRPVRVDGNTLYLATDTPVFFERLNGQVEKLRIIERALERIHRQRLRVQVMLVENFETIQTVPRPSNADPLLSVGLEFGAQISQDDGD